MSLSLVNDYSSEEEKVDVTADDSDDSSNYEDDASPTAAPAQEPEQQERRAGKGGSLLPSPDDLFSEVTGPPEYLKTSSAQPNQPQEFFQRSQPAPVIPTSNLQRGQDRRQAYPQAVVESKPKLLSSYNQVQIESEDRASDSPTKATPRRPLIAPENNPPKDGEKRNKSTVKDKEKNKRMKGQSSHATWKSETEMHLRQQFD